MRNSNVNKKNLTIKISEKKGYKHTSMGRIPKDWNMVRMQEICKVNQGLQIPVEKRLKHFINGARIYITIQYLNNGKEAEYILNANTNVCCEEDDILMTRTGNTGIIITNVNGVFHNNFFKINYDRKKVNKKYLIEYLSDYKTQHTIIVKAGTNTIPDLNHNDFYSIYLPLPPLPEQRRIAALLSTWDEAITKTQQLIEQLEARNKGLMQQLLTGKKRLKGFSEEWKEYRLDNFFKERNETKNIELPLLSIGQNGVYPQSDSEKKDISNIDKSKYKKICSGDIGYNTMRMWQGRSALSHMEGIVSPAYTIAIPKKNVNPLFFSYLFKTPKLMNLFWRNSQGLVDDTLNCKFKDFIIVKIPLPEREEQTAIASILKKATEEMKLYEQKLAALKEQKKGLMQILLTGKKRLKLKC